MRILLFFVFAGLVQMQAYAGEYLVSRLSVRQMLRSTGKACETFGSSMQDEHFVCVGNEWKIRYFLVAYKFRGETKIVETQTCPKKTFRVDENGNIIQPDRTMHGQY